MSSERLHPNLARLAVEHRRVRDDIASGVVSAEEGHRQLLGLVARDDEGVAWTLTPDNVWMFWASTGAWTPAAPPQQGVVTLSAFQVSGLSPADPDLDVVWERTGSDPGRDILQGSTRRPRFSRDEQLRSWKPVFVTVAVVVMLAAARWISS